MRCAFCLARASAGSNMLARMAMIAITTNNSIRVKAPIFLSRIFFIYLWLIFQWSAHCIKTILQCHLNFVFLLAGMMPSAKNDRIPSLLGHFELRLREKSPAERKLHAYRV